MTPASSSQSSSANSGHSVTRIAASAPSSAAATEEAISTSGSNARAGSAAAGSYADHGALALQARGQHEAGGVAHVVGVRLEGEAEQSDTAAGEFADVLLELADTRRFCSSLTSMTALRSWKW